MLSIILSFIFKLLNIIFNFFWKDVYLDFIFTPFVKVTYGEFVDNASNTVFSFSFVSELTYRCKAVAWGLFILIAVFQSFKAMFAHLGFETDEAWKIAMRALFFGVLLHYSDDMCKQIYNLYDGCRSIFIDGLAMSDAMVNLSNEFRAANFLSLQGILYFWVSIKLMFLAMKFAERMMLTCFLTIFSPLAVATGTNKATKPIFAGWVKMYVGNLVVQLLQVVILLGLSSFIAKDYDFLKNNITYTLEIDPGNLLYQAIDKVSNSSNIINLNFIIPLLVFLALVEILDKVDEIVKESSLGVGISSGPVGGIGSMLNAASNMQFQTERTAQLLGKPLGFFKAPSSSRNVPMNPGK